MKTVSVFHDELTATHQAETRPRFITKLGLDLVKIERQFPVGPHRAAYQIGNDFFMRRTEAEIAVVAVFETNELFAVLFPPTALLPKLGG